MTRLAAMHTCPVLFNLEVTGEPANAGEFSPLVVKWRNGAPVRLQDIATVTDSVEDER